MIRNSISAPQQVLFSWQLNCLPAVPYVGCKSFWTHMCLPEQAGTVVCLMMHVKVTFKKVFSLRCLYTGRFFPAMFDCAASLIRRGRSLRHGAAGLVLSLLFLVESNCIEILRGEKKSWFPSTENCHCQTLTSSVPVAVMMMGKGWSLLPCALFQTYWANAAVLQSSLGACLYCFLAVALVLLSDLKLLKHLHNLKRRECSAMKLCC